eukprot:234864-Hanusia_phi.AAC.1
MSSEVSKESYINESDRMILKHRQVLWKILKDFKINHRGKVPRLCTVVTKMLHQCNKKRICSPSWDEEHRRSVALKASEYIARFLIMLSQKFKQQLSTFKGNILFIGIV